MTDSFIDLRSDTVTRPTPAMREAMAHAEVGDDMVGEDPTVNRLEAIARETFGKPAAVFACSGTQSNQMAVRAHCQPGDELLIHESGHIANFEAGGPAILSGVSTRTLPGPWGMLEPATLEGKIRGVNQHCVRTRLLCLENTTNMGGGRAYDLDRIAELTGWARENGLRTHLDGARLYNACVARGYEPAEVAAHFDSVSVCFSKGLGCPMGSILVGSEETIASARRSRKVFGGALRQAGIVAASAIHALEHHVDRLAEDHANARLFAELVAEIDGIVIDPDDIETNLVFFEITPGWGTADALQAALSERGVKMYSTDPQRLRACTHLDVDESDIRRAADAIREAVAAPMPVGAAGERY